MEDRKRCPFCGNDDSEMRRDDIWHYVFCCCCECQGPLCQREEQAIETWNDREPHDKPNLRAEIGTMILEMCNGDTTEAEDMLEYLTTWQNKKGETVKGRRSAKLLSDRQAPVTHRKVTEQYNKWVQTQADGDGGSSAGEPLWTPPNSLLKELLRIYR